MDTGEGPTISQKVRFFLLYFIHCRNMLNAEKVSFFNRKRGGESSPSGDMLIKISEAPDCNQSGTSFSEEIFPLYNKSPKVTLLVALRNLAPPKSTQHPRGLEVNPPPFLFILVYSCLSFYARYTCQTVLGNFRDIMFFIPKILLHFFLPFRVIR